MQKKARYIAAVCLALGAAALTGCGGDVETSKPSAALMHTDSEAAVIATVAAKLRTHCKSCHGVGDMRFIRSNDDAELWSYLFTNRAPNSGKLWAKAIVEVLSWPTDGAPAPSDIMDPVGRRDWMPKGQKRLQLADDIVEGAPTRRLILETLGRHLR